MHDCRGDHRVIIIITVTVIVLKTRIEILIRRITRRVNNTAELAFLHSCHFFVLTLSRGSVYV